MPSIGKVSFPADKFMKMLWKYCKPFSKLKPSAAKGTYFKSIHISSNPWVPLERLYKLRTTHHVVGTAFMTKEGVSRTN